MQCLSTGEFAALRVIERDLHLLARRIDLSSRSTLERWGPWEGLGGRRGCGVAGRAGADGQERDSVFEGGKVPVAGTRKEWRPAREEAASIWSILEGGEDGRLLLGGGGWWENGAFYITSLAQA